MKKNNDVLPFKHGSTIGMRRPQTSQSSNKWRASLVPAAAVIPAPLAYIKVVAVKKLVVEFLANSHGMQPLKACAFLIKPLSWLSSSNRSSLFRHFIRVRSRLEQDQYYLYRFYFCYSRFTLRKLECSQQAVGM